MPRSACTIEPIHTNAHMHTKVWLFFAPMQSDYWSDEDNFNSGPSALFPFVCPVQYETLSTDELLTALCVHLAVTLTGLTVFISIDCASVPTLLKWQSVCAEQDQYAITVCIAGNWMVTNLSSFYSILIASCSSVNYWTNVLHWQLHVQFYFLLTCRIFRTSFDLSSTTEYLMDV